jgi:hypothetical protein
MSLNIEISSGFNTSDQSFMLSVYVYAKNDHTLPNVTFSSNYASTYISKTVRNMDKIILLRYTIYNLNNFQCTYLTEQRKCKVNFLDGRANF